MCGEKKMKSFFGRNSPPPPNGEGGGAGFYVPLAWTTLITGETGGGRGGDAFRIVPAISVNLQKTFEKTS